MTKRLLLDASSLSRAILISRSGSVVVSGFLFYVFFLLSVSLMASSTGTAFFSSAHAQPADKQEMQTQNGMAMHGDPKYGPDFQNFDYVNPSAPKGGTLHLHAIGTFDSLNPYLIKGVPANGLTYLGPDLVTQSLVAHSYDEPFSQYGLLAESMEVAKDKSWVIYTLHSKARWHDGQPVTADDVLWSFHTLMEKGSPFFKAYYGNVEKVEKLSPRRVKFTFSSTGGEVNAELPMIMGQLPVLPKHYWEGEGRDFGRTTLDPAPGSGPYKITDIKPGTSITYERVTDWWGADLPVNKGRYNFDRIIYDYYRDGNVALEAFLSGEYDVREENVAKLWETAYDVEQVKTGKVIKTEIPNSRPAGMQGFVFNLRRDVFADRSVRKALDYAFDFEWSNKQFAYGSYKRTDSYFENSDLAAEEGVPRGSVREILESLQQEFGEKLNPEVLSQRYTPPQTDGSGNNRANLRKAKELLEKAGYVLNKNGVRVHKETGQKLKFEILAGNSMFERWVLPFIRNLERIGVAANFRVVDPAQYQNRIRDFNFDMVITTFPQSSSPGNEQRDFWSSAKAQIPGSRNLIGIQDPVIDRLIEMIIHADSREQLVARTRALDRVLLAGHYVIPQWHTSSWRVAYRDFLGRPESPAPYALGITDTWWHAQSAAGSE